MKHQSRPIIRLGDTTDHGGKVVSASSGTIVMGREAAVEGDMTFCPKCKGQFPIKPEGAGARHQGKPYAYDNDLTACGAKLVAS
ncbi:MAG: hypothetical protein JWP59_4784 [Massilia sp.]|nr:hypothetical protein [Massilia sp.]